MRIQRKFFVLALCVVFGAIAIGDVATTRARKKSSRHEPGPPGGIDAGLRSGPTEPPPPQAPAQGDIAERKPDPKLKTFVSIALEGPPTRDKEALAKEVEKVLRLWHPQNPGRQATFGKMALRGLTPQNRETHLLKQTGWSLVIQKVERLPGGWRARIAVLILATKINFYPALVMNRHIEVYSFRGGNLILESDWVEPRPPVLGPEYEGYDPSHGLIEDPVVGMPEPPKPFLVETSLEGNPTDDERKLAREVEEELGRRQPENPGRDKTFAKMECLGVGPDGKALLWKLKRLGWTLMIRRVERIPGGWRATVHVYIRATSPEGVMPSIGNHHIEIYSFRGGKLTLESDAVDLNSHPSKGLAGGIF